MKKGTKVTWQNRMSGYAEESGTVLFDEDDGKVIVAVNGFILNQVPSSYHLVIWCDVKDLTVTV